MRTIQIDNELILVEVPKDAKIIAIVSNGIEYITDNTYVAQYIDFNNRINEIIGLIETPNVDFDFEVDESWVEKEIRWDSTFYLNYIETKMLNELIKMFSLEDKKKSFITRIQRKIQDAGIELTGNLLLIKKLK
jgi:hypothetical protein